MDIKKFRGFLKQLCNYYQQSPPREEAQALWFQRVQSYGDEVLRFAYDEITRNHEVFPKNLPNTVGTLWGKWLNDHPERERKYRQCSDPWCDQGEIHAARENKDGTVTVTAFRCRVCSQSRMAWPEAASVDLEARGWKLDCTEETNRRLAKQVKAGNVVRGNFGKITEAWGENEWLKHSRLMQS